MCYEGSLSLQCCNINIRIKKLSVVIAISDIVADREAETPECWSEHHCCSFSGSIGGILQMFDKVSWVDGCHF
ncbi:hypothetical protein L1987_43651 [Smallanthus sonchifolius]|uniref:Uncharacterized protein n=1 Tax=Smallanthus sonchifolius TaxID=185202 RepID=A0ACB9GMY0_9ASTR|nr:hypothetical protein L1987_43651 [Smallanthus sonchifolius]